MTAQGSPREASSASSALRRSCGTATSKPPDVCASQSSRRSFSLRAASQSVVEFAASRLARVPPGANPRSSKSRDAETSAEDLRDSLAGYANAAGKRGAAGALLFSCTGRGRRLYGTPDHDAGVFRDALGPLPLGGFFCNGEIGPVGGTTYLHGYTSSFALFRPRTGAGRPGP